MKASDPQNIDNLVRILFSVLELKRDCEHYASLAESQEDIELACFFAQIQQHQDHLALQIREKLHSKTGWAHAAQP